MNFRVKDKDGNLFFLEYSYNSFTLRSADGGTQLELFDMREYVGTDKNGRDVYVGDTIITPKKKFEWSWDDIYETHGEELLIENNISLTRGQLAKVVAASTLKE